MNGFAVVMRKYINLSEQKTQFFLLVLLVFASFFLGSGNAFLFDEDEGAFSEATREMMVSGNYLSTTMNAHPRFDKPILSYWFMAASATVFGLNEFAMRFPSAMAASIWVLSLFLFCRRLYPAKIAFPAAFMLASSLHISIIGKAATADALLNCFLANSMFQLLLWFRNSDRKHIVLFFLFCALGVLTKGPVAILIPAAVSGIYAAVFKKWSHIRRLVFDLRGLTVFIVIALPWYIAEYIVNGQDFIYGFFYVHHIDRFSSTLENHAGGILYYIPVVILAVMPYSGLLIAFLKNVRRFLKDENEAFFLIWFAFVFLFFSFSGTKLPHYTIYGYTPLFILFASLIDSKTGKVFSLRHMIVFLFLMAAAMAFLPELSPFMEDDYSLSLLLALWEVYFPGRFLILLSAGILLMYINRLSRDSLYRIRFAGFANVLILNLILLGPINRIMQLPVARAAQIVKEKNLQAILYKHNSPSFLFYLETTIPDRVPESGDIIFTKRQNLEDFDSYEIIYEEYGMVLARVFFS